VFLRRHKLIITPLQNSRGSFIRLQANYSVAKRAGHGEKKRNQIFHSLGATAERADLTHLFAAAANAGETAERKQFDRKNQIADAATREGR